jgi:ATP-binding cassette subfamily C protein CydCD
MIIADRAGWAGWLLGGAFLARAALSWAEQVVAQRTAAQVAGELRRAMVRAALRRGPAWAAHFGTGRLTSVLTTGLDALRPWFGSYLPALVLGVTLPPLVVAAIALVDPTSAVIALVTLPLIPVLGALIGWATQARARQRWAADARLAGHFLDVVRGLPTLRVFGRAARQASTIAELTDRHRSATLRVLRVAFLSSTALDLVGTLSVGLIAVEAGLRVAAGDLALSPALLVILLAPEAYRPLREMAARYHAAADATAVIADVDEILSAPAPAPAETGDGVGVFAAGVRARYPGATADALVLPELVVHGGEIVALSGPSGAGKTTALRVLAGLHPAEAGVVAAERPLYLPQRPALPHARTVADLFDTTPDSPAGSAGSDRNAERGGADEIDEALRMVGLAGEVDAATPLGEHGAGVSAGQRHRLALAALLHRAGRTPATLLLDEPTAHLDAATEALVIARLRAAAAAGSAVLVVAHRPALLAAADRTVTLTAPPTAAPPSAESTGSGTAEASAATAEPVAARFWRRPWAAVALGSGSALAGLVLTGAAAWLLVRASSLPPVLTLSTAVVLVRGSAVARPLLRYLERLVAHDVAFARLGARRARIYAALIPRVPGPRLRRRGDLLSRAVDDVDAQVDGLLRGRLPALSAAVTLAVAVPVVAALAPAALLPLATGLLLAGVVAPAIAARQAARAEAATAAARARLRDAMVETVGGLEERPADAVPEERSATLAHLEERAARTAGGAAALAHLGWGIAVAGTALSLDGLSAEWAAVLLLIVVVLGETVLTLPDAAVARRRATAADERIIALTDDPPTATFPAEGPDLNLKGVRVRGLTAGWDPAREPVLRGLDLDLAPGERVAVLGRSGAGKSTLGAVLARLLDPRSGTVELGGVDVTDLPEHAVRGRIVLVGDDTGHIFASTVRENLRLGCPGADDAALRDVLTRVRLDDWLARLEHGLDTWLGSDGSTMSGGQARRFATARALLADPDLLILDEPTEGLDAPTAKALMGDLLDATGGRTVLLLTHRTEGLSRCDRRLTLTG